MPHKIPGYAPVNSDWIRRTHSFIVVVVVVVTPSLLSIELTTMTLKKSSSLRVSRTALTVIFAIVIFWPVMLPLLSTRMTTSFGDAAARMYLTQRSRTVYDLLGNGSYPPPSISAAPTPNSPHRLLASKLISAPYGERSYDKCTHSTNHGLVLESKKSTPLASGGIDQAIPKYINRINFSACSKTTLQQ